MVPATPKSAGLMSSPIRPSKRARRHPGVVLLKPDPVRRIGWRARYKDPDSGTTVKETLPHLLSTREAREDWATRKSRALEKRKLELSEGAPRATSTALRAATDRFFEAHARLRDKTLRDYRAAVEKLLRWAPRAGVQSTDDLTRAKLMGLREQLIKEPKRAPARGGKRGARVTATGAQRSPFSVNREFASLRAVLGYLADLDLLTKVKEGDLRIAFKKLPKAVERIEFLGRDELRQLFEAVARHDAATFTETRAEHKSRNVGKTPRFDPIELTVAIILLSGMRLGEALSLEWSQVDLEAPDNEGRPMGEIRLTGATKTKRARVIDLAVSPALRAILAALRPKDGKGRVLNLTSDGAASAMGRLRSDFDAPASFNWQALRATCGTYLTNAPGIFGAASAYRSARQLGHSVAVAERHYLGLVRGIPATSRTLEAAMGLEAELAKIGRN